MKKGSKNLLRSILGTMIGVMAAFLLNNWNTNRINKNRSQKVLENINKEITNNEANLEDAYVASNETLPSLTKLILEYEIDGKILMTTEEMKNYQKVFPNKFFISDSIEYKNEKWDYKGTYNFPKNMFVHIVLKENSWKSAQSIGALNEINFDCIQNLEQIYSMQSQVIMQSEKLMNALDVNMKEYLKILNNLIQYEKLLIEFYDMNKENHNKC